MNTAFSSLLTRRERRLGWCYFPVHFLLLPALSIAFAPALEGLGVGVVNLIYYGIGLVFLALFLLPWLYRQYCVFYERPFYCLGQMAGGYLVDYGLSALVVLLLGAVVPESGENPNNTFIFAQQGFDARAVQALALYIAPVLEEVLMRGVVFGTLRERSRGAAYGVSVLLFSLCHVWQYVLASGDGQLWIYVLQYIPASVGLCWCYERSGSVWTPILLHMLINSMGYTLLGM